MTALDNLARSLAERPRPVALYGAPEGYEAAAIGDIIAEGHVLPWLHVCRDDGRMARFAAALAFFHPELDALTFPAWDCLPYDRVSPNSEIVSRRIDTLTRLATGGGDTPLVVLTTVNALIQRVPPRSLFDGRVLALRPGGRIGLDRLQSFFSNNGYMRTDTVREPGEFAVRGGIVDLYPAGAAEPLRLDFFGDTLESIRSFDPLTQRSTGKLDQAALRPVSEVLLDDGAIRRFRSRYREQFGATGTDDPLYKSVSAGRRYVGMEHWLPLYYEQLETLFDYLPGAGVSFDLQADEVRDHRLEAIADFYAARHNVTGAARAGAPIYRPVRPEPALPRQSRMAGRVTWTGSRPAIAFRLTRGHSATSSMPVPAQRETSLPSGPTRMSCCSRRCAIILITSAKPDERRRSRRSARAQPNGSSACCASAAFPT